MKPPRARGNREAFSLALGPRNPKEIPRYLLRTRRQRHSEADSRTSRSGKRPGAAQRAPSRAHHSPATQPVALQRWNYAHLMTHRLRKRKSQRGVTWVEGIKTPRYPRWIGHWHREEKRLKNRKRKTPLYVWRLRWTWSWHSCHMVERRRVARHEELISFPRNVGAWHQHIYG